MLIIFGVTLLLSSTVSCVDQICSFNQTGTCYAALGHKLSLQMVQDTRDLELKLIKQNITNNTNYPVITVKKNSIRDEHESIRNRFEFIMNNGSLIINSVIRADSGRYTLKILNSAGSQTHAVDLQVNVEAPIGSVEVSIICSSSGVKGAFCSSEGEELLFSWTLNGDPLTLKDGNKSFIHLDEETSGNITCSVKNHVSHGEKSTTVNSCTGTTTTPVTSHLTSTLTNSTTSGAGNSTSVSGSNLTDTAGFPSWMTPSVALIVLGCVTVILIVLVITVYHIYKRKKRLKSSTEAADTAGDTDVIYVHINHEKSNRDNKQKKPEESPAAEVEYAAVGPQKKRKKIKEEEVEYGQVTFTPSNIQQQVKEREECVYSQVHTHT